MYGHIGRCVNTFVLFHVMSLGLPVVRRTLIYRVVRRQMWIGERVLVAGWMHHGLRGLQGNIFVFLFPFQASITIGIIFLTTNRASKQVYFKQKFGSRKLSNCKIVDIHKFKLFQMAVFKIRLTRLGA